MAKKFPPMKFFHNFMKKHFPMRDFLEGEDSPEKMPFHGMHLRNRLINRETPMKFFHNKHKKHHLKCTCMEKHFPMRDFIEEEAPPEKAFSLHKYERTPYMLALIGSAFLLLGIMSLAGLTEIGKSWWYWPAFGCFLAATITYYQRNQANKEEMSKRDVKRDTIDPRTSGKSVEKNPPKSQELQETRDERFSFCPYCGGSISELAVYCPFCGYILKD